MSETQPLQNLGIEKFQMGIKKARHSFVARRFPVYNLMKSVESVVNKLFSFLFFALLISY
jgi:hypothetical protein